MVLSLFLTDRTTKNGKIHLQLQGMIPCDFQIIIFNYCNVARNDIMAAELIGICHIFKHLLYVMYIANIVDVLQRFKLD